MTPSAPSVQVPLPSRAEQRAAQRLAVAMPLHGQGLEGTTRDLSSSGLAFDAERAYAPGERVRITIEYLLDGHNYPLDCEVEVVRCEADGDRFRIGARLLAPLDGGNPPP